MEKSFWHERWLKNQIAFHQQQTSPYLEKYWSKLNIAKNSSVFVPLCGKSLDMLYLQRVGHQVLGIEIDESAVKAFFAENELSVEQQKKDKYDLWKSQHIQIIRGDFFDLTNETCEIKAIFDRASLVALPQEMRKKYAQHITKITPKDCKILLVVFEYSQEKMSGPPFSIDRQKIDELFCDFKIEHLETSSALEENPIFLDRGLSELHESVYILEK